jgi:uncharacterized protein (DUF1778 family)
VPAKTVARSIPKRRKAIRKEETIHVRVTSEQKEILTAAAECEGLGVSTWLLTVGLREARNESKR